MSFASQDGRFRTTQWSLVAAARDEEDPQSRLALSELCESYWQPLYVFIRRRGHSAADAEDLTQGFFHQLLEKNYLSQADRDRGRFRTFLLAAVKHFLANQAAKSGAQRRGGGHALLSLDFALAESNYRAEPVETWTPEALYERQWALTLLSNVVARLEQKYEQSGKGELFRWLKPTLTGGTPSSPYNEVARQLETTTGAVKVAAHRLRDAYRRELCDAIADTLSGDDDVESERVLLLRALAGDS
ncbi:MAG: sigma-70 family RNA polymerase sigma factor [Planctomycetales bacterium]|nr:sigma-70 family RNA polymerase sigma factor [Planctomycetales bacterium]